MATRSEKTKAGAFFVGGVLLLVGFLVFLGYLQLREEGVKYFSVFSEVGQLSKGAPVKYNGVQVGKVADVKISRETGGKVRATYLIQKPELITSETVAKLGYLSPLSGTQYISLEPGQTQQAATAEQMPADSRIPSKPSAVQTTFKDIRSSLEKLNELLKENKEGISTIVENSNQMMQDIQRTLFADRKASEDVPEGSLVQIVRSTAATTEELQKTARTLNETIEQLGPGVESTVKATEQTAEEMGRMAEEIKNTVSRVQEIMNGKKFKTSVDHLAGSLKDVEALTTQSVKLTRTMRKLSKQIGGEVEENLPVFRSTLKSLERTSRNLERLSTKLQRNPSALFNTEPPAKRELSE